MGVFQTVYDNIARLAGDAWGFMVGLLIIVAMLGGLYYTLQGGAGMAFGGSKMAGMAIIGIVSLVILVLVAFLILPELGDVLKNNTPRVPWDMGSGSFFIPLNLLRFRGMKRLPEPISHGTFGVLFFNTSPSSGKIRKATRTRTTRLTIPMIAMPAILLPPNAIPAPPCKV